MSYITNCYVLVLVCNFAILHPVVSESELEPISNIEDVANYTKELDNDDIDKMEEAIKVKMLSTSQRLFKEDSGCACPLNYSPICATNGETYGNECALECDQKKNPYLLGVCRGECPCCHPPYYNKRNLPFESGHFEHESSNFGPPYPGPPPSFFRTQGMRPRPRPNRNMANSKDD